MILPSQITMYGATSGCRLDVTELEPGVQIARLTVELPAIGVPQPLKLSMRYPLGDIYAHWTPDNSPTRFFDRSLQPPWETFRTSATCGAPVSCSYSQAGDNRVTLALSDARNPVTLATVPDELRGELLCTLTLFELPLAPLQCYEASLRLDTRPVPYYEALGGVRDWWAAMPEYAPAPVPGAAREPVYSTWYAHQQRISAELVEDECRRAKSLGCEVVIVDDGWQTEDLTWGYERCGDWVPSSTKFAEMRAHVERVHALGMRYVLWFSVPFVGALSKAWPSYKDKLLTREPLLADGRWGVLDPRFSDVREMLASTLARAAREWGLDGLKLDFIDEFQLSEDDVLGGDRDTDSVVDAVDQLLTAITEELRAANPSVAVEFRQTYTGPLMRRFGNMLRASDCPCDALENRARTLALRLLAGSTPVHSDPLVWDPEAGCEAAAAQLISVIFAVPQISMPLRALGADHMDALRFWLRFWNQHKSTLLDGGLRPLHPELNYPVVIAEGERELIAAMYHQEVLTVDEPPPTVYVVNGTAVNRLVLELPAREVACLVRDCRGHILSEEHRLLGGLQAFSVPPCGLLELHVG